MKRVCADCDSTRHEKASKLSSLLGVEYVEKLLYGMFNPESLEQEEDRPNNNLEIEPEIQRHMGKQSGLENSEHSVSDPHFNWLYKGMVNRHSRLESARNAVWASLEERIRKRELTPKDLPAHKILKNFPRKILNELAADGYIDIRWMGNLMHPKVYHEYTDFTPESEKVLAKKVLEEVFKNLEKARYGAHTTARPGVGSFPSYMISEFDESLHSFDNLDIQETLVSAAQNDPDQMKLSSDMFMARVPLHRSESANVILLDISGSMYGDKFRGGIMACLALWQLMKDEFKDDLLDIVAYNDEPQLAELGTLLKLRPHGQTDIGRALEMSAQILRNRTGNKNIFLITDSEPTTSNRKNLSPLENMFRAAQLLAAEEITITVVMLDSNPMLRRISETLALVNRKSNLVYIDDPLNLKDFIIRSFLDHKEMS